MGFVCDICGGTSVVKRDGAFSCENCGVKYDVEEVRKMMGSAAAPARPVRPSRVGETVRFGSFVQDAGGKVLAGWAAPDRMGNIEKACEEAAGLDPEPIEWRIMAEEVDRELLVSAQAIAARRYDASNADVVWADSDLRAWLNGAFLEESFSEEERALIVEADVANAANAGYRVDAGPDTRDKVFVLSLSEAKELFPASDERLCRPTKHAQATGAWVNEMGYARWWLRTPGFGQNMAACVETSGEVLPQGVFVDNAGGAVRPALWRTRPSDEIA